MHRPRILIADDTPEKLSVMLSIVASSRPDAQIDTATSIPQTLELIRRNGKNYCRSVIDFDFPADRNVGSVIIRAIRNTRNAAPVVCATARPEGTSFDEAAEDAIAAGASHAFCFEREDFAENLRTFVN